MSFSHGLTDFPMYASMLLCVQYIDDFQPDNTLRLWTSLKTQVSILWRRFLQYTENHS